MTTTETHGHGHGHGGGHTPAAGETMLYHHFDDLAQQDESSKLGMWAFLATEVLFFGGLFTAYAVYRNIYHRSFVAAGQHLNVVLGGINTAVLLCSSLTMALAVRCAHLHRVRETVLYLVLTMILGAGFLGIKAKEWYDDYQEHLMPGINFDWELAQHGHHGGEAGAEGSEEEGTVHTVGAGEGKSVAPSASRARLEEAGPSPLVPPPGGLLGEEPTSTPGGRAQLFFVLYFFMTGLHAIHLIIGIVLVGVIAWLVWRGWASGTGSTHVEVTGLYWHFIDIVWVYLYPILYLIDIKQ